MVCRVILRGNLYNDLNDVVNHLKCQCITKITRTMYVMVCFDGWKQHNWLFEAGFFCWKNRQPAGTTSKWISIFLFHFIFYYVLCSIFDSSKLIFSLFWSSRKTINFVWCLWLIDIKSDSMSVMIILSYRLSLDNIFYHPSE